MIRRAVATASMLCALGWLAARASAQERASGPWGLDARRSGRSSAQAPHERPKRIWTVRLSGRGLVPPALLKSGLLLVGSRSGLHALDAGTGVERWFAEVGPVRFSPIPIGDGDEAIVIGGGRTYRVSASGKLRALLPQLRAAPAAPLLEGQRLVLVGSFEPKRPAAASAKLAPSSVPPSAPDPQELVAASLEGELLSATAIGIEHPRLLASVAPGLAAVAGRDAFVSRAPTEGFGARLIDVGDAVASLLVGDHAETIAITESDQLIVLEPSGQLRRIAASEPRAITVGPALGRDGALRIGLEGGELLSLSLDGSEHWRRGLDGRPGPILLDNTDTALFATSRGTLYAIDAGGELRWLLPADALRAARPVLGRDGTLYVVFRGGLIAAYR